MNYFRKLRIISLYKDGFSKDELMLIYQDWLPSDYSEARKALNKVLKGVKRNISYE